MKSLENACGQVAWPVTWVEGGSCSGECIGGMQVHAVSGVSIRTVFADTKPIARVFEDDLARHCMLGNVLSNSSSASREEQAWQAMENMDKGYGIRPAGDRNQNLIPALQHLIITYCVQNFLSQVHRNYYKVWSSFDGEELCRNSTSKDNTLRRLCARQSGSGDRIRTYDTAGMSRML